MNIIKRAINRIGFKYGIRLFPWADEFMLNVAGGSPQIFDAIAETRYWGSDESISGGGSTRQWTASYAARLEDFLRGNFSSMFDAPCGDLNWMPDVVRHTGLKYIGGDVSDVVLTLAREKRPDLDVRKFDIRTDEFPDVDLWHCRDCLFHLSYEDIFAALRNFSNSNVDYALITTHMGRYVRNMDIATGGHRVLDLTRPPFRLPKPRKRIRDFPEGKAFPRYVGLWSRREIAKALR